MLRKRARRRNRRKVTSQPSQPHAFLRNNLFGLISLMVTTVIAVVTYQLSLIEPDLRPTKVHLGSDAVETSIGVRDANGNCVYHRRMRIPFRNLSWRSGFINNVTFSNESFDTLPDYKLIEIDKTPIGWGEEKEIQLKYLFIADPATCDKLSQKEAVEVGIRFYDDKGKMINRDVDGHPFDFGLWKNND